jgi:hypothetical protein
MSHALKLNVSIGEMVSVFISPGKENKPSGYPNPVDLPTERENERL